MRMKISWIRVASQDLFPIRQRRWHSIVSWFPALILVGAISITMAVGFLFEAFIIGAKTMLSDPGQLRRIAVKCDPLKQKLLNSNGIQEIKDIPGVEDIFCYNRLTTITIKSNTPMGERKIYKSVRTIDKNDPMLLHGLEWEIPSGLPIEKIFQDSKEWGILVSKNLLEQLLIFDKVGSRLSANLREKQNIWQNKKLKVDEKIKKITELEILKRKNKDCFLNLILPANNNKFNEIFVPILGILKAIPGESNPEAIVVPSFFEDYKRGSIEPNPYIEEFFTEVNFSKICNIYKAWGSSQYKEKYSILWGTSNIIPYEIYNTPIEKSHFELIAEQNKENLDLFLIEIYFQPNLKDAIKLDEMTEDLLNLGLSKEEILTTNYRPNSKFLSGEESSEYWYADVYVKDMELYLEIHDSIRALGFITNNQQYDNIIAIRKRLAFFRSQANNVWYIANIISAIIIMFMQMLLAHFRVKEMAIFRAHGASANLILWLYCWKGIILWFIAYIISIGISIIVWFLRLRGVLERAFEKTCSNDIIWQSLKHSWLVSFETLLFCLFGVVIAAIFTIKISNPATVLKS